MNCIKCQSLIPKERLEAVPDAVRCVSCEEEYGQNFKVVANVYATPRHKGWEVQVVRVPVDKPKIPRRVEDTPSQAKSPENISPSVIPPRVVEHKDDSSVDKTICFACKKGNKQLEGYYPFPGVYCPRDKRRAREGRFILRKLWEEVDNNVPK